MNKIVVGLGEILWDVFPERKILGGAPANFAFHASQFGLHGYAVSAVGNDLLGQEILDNLKEKKLNYRIEKTDFPTGTVQVTIDEIGNPKYEICENTAWDNIPFTKNTEDIAKNTHTVCFGSLAQRGNVSRETIRKFLAAMPENSLKIFDINLRQHYYNKELIEESLKLSNMLKLNEEEIVAVNRLFEWNISEEDACKKLQNDYHIDILVLTKGTDGSYVYHNKGISFLNTPKVRVIDTVGAGDAFTGAFTAAIMQDESIERAHRLAVDVAAFVCTQQGAMPKIPYCFR